MSILVWRTSRLFRLSLLTGAAVAACPSHAQTLAALDPVVVTAARTPQRLSQAVADVRVIDRAAIERLGIGGLADLLRREAGLEMSRNGGPGASTSVYLRGADSRHTVVLLDGVRIDSQATGGASWSGIALTDIERVEILSGPASALYGSDAIGGVVQLFTRQGGAGVQGKALLAAGNLGQRRVEASVGGRDGGLHGRLGLLHERATGFNASTDPSGFAWSPDRDGWQRRSATLRAGATVAEGHTLDATVSAARTRTQFDGWDANADDRDVQRQTAVQLGWQSAWSSALRTEVQAGESRDRYAIPNFSYQADTRVRQSGIVAFWTPQRGQQWQAVLERRDDRLRDAGLSGAGAERQLDSLGLGWSLTDPTHTVQLNARRDRDSQHGTVHTGLLGASVTLAPGWRLAGSAGTGFRSPTVYQLASPYGVRSLRPERSRNAELALRWQDGDIRASLTAYRQTVRDLIGFGAAGPCASAFGCYENVARATLQGLSLRADGRWGSSLGWRASADWSDPTNAVTGKRLARRAERHGRLSLDWQPAPGWSVGAHALLSSARFDDAANTRRLGGYVQLDLDARWQFHRDWALEAQLGNATQQAQALARGYAVTPRSLLVGLRSRW